ncbi:hypothetical protein ANN_11509 [Periplaneta americana]|uniref:Uncharacterized protein n=1 Tax=Periplaneta americana TaxID=6978 RepID=A0ABQ8T6C3_PERAM|nr:hypothetical protein ANN_11509 [Periplaneta americana]
MDVTCVEQCSYIKKPFSVGEMLENDTEAVGNNALPYRTVARFSLGTPISLMLVRCRPPPMLYQGNRSTVQSLQLSCIPPRLGVLGVIEREQSEAQVASILLAVLNCNLLFRYELPTVYTKLESCECIIMSVCFTYTMSQGITPARRTTGSERERSATRDSKRFRSNEKGVFLTSQAREMIYDVSIICQPDRSRLVPVAWQQWSKMEALIPSPAACEVRSAIKFFNAQIHRQLCQVYEPNIMSKQMVRHWCRQFSEGRQSVHDEERSGRPSSSMMIVLSWCGSASWRTVASRLRS